MDRCEILNALETSNNINAHLCLPSSVNLRMLSIVCTLSNAYSFTIDADCLKIMVVFLYRLFLIKGLRVSKTVLLFVVILC